MQSLTKYENTRDGMHCICICTHAVRRAGTEQTYVVGFFFTYSVAFLLPQADMYNSARRSLISAVMGEYPGTEEGTILRMEDGGPEELVPRRGGGLPVCLTYRL